MRTETRSPRPSGPAGLSGPAHRQQDRRVLAGARAAATEHHRRRAVLRSLGPACDVLAAVIASAATFGVAADGLTQATQTGVQLLTSWLGGVVFAGWAAAFAAAGTLRTIRRDIT